PGFICGTTDAQLGISVSERVFESVGQRPPLLLCRVIIGSSKIRFKRLCRTGQDFIVYIGDIAHQGDLISGIFKPADQDVKDDGGTNMSNVWSALYCCATVINRDFSVVDRFEISDCTGSSIIKSLSHAA